MSEVNTNVENTHDDSKEWIDVLTSPGFLQLCIGPMFAGKTSHLLSIIKKFNATFVDFLVVKPLIDNRYSLNAEITSHNKESYPCIVVKELKEININDIKQYILIEEGQFFPDLYETVVDWIEEGRYIYVAGLIGDSDMKHFGDMTELMPVADEIKFLHARCDCGKLASFTSLYKHDKKTDDHSQILIGGADIYRPTCRKCHNNNPN
jgi:thymidine kinase